MPDRETMSIGFQGSSKVLQCWLQGEVEGSGEAPDSEDESGPESEDPALKQLMARPDGLKIMLRARKLVRCCCCCGLADPHCPTACNVAAP